MPFSSLIPIAHCATPPRRGPSGPVTPETQPFLPRADQGRRGSTENDEVSELRRELKELRDEMRRLREELAVVRSLATHRPASMPYRGPASDD